MDEMTRRRWEVVATFLKIGALGYGPAAIWGLIQAEVQERRAWLTKERYLEGVALVNVLPGATAMQMCIFVGHERAGWWGGVLAGLAFMAPAFAIICASSQPPSIVFRSATIGTPGNSARKARTPFIPSAIISGVPASSQSTPERMARCAVSMAS